MRTFPLLIALVASAVALPARAEGVIIGGYDVAMVASATVELLAEKRVITAAEAKGMDAAIASLPSSDPLLSAAPAVDLYEGIFQRLADRGIASPAEIAAMKKAAAESGGVKANGMNPLLLAASCLDLLSKKSLIPLPEAQKILDTARR